MKSPGFWKRASCAVGTLCLATAALAQAPAKPAAAPKGATVVNAVEVTATVTRIDQNTREVTVKTDDGREFSFVAGDAVKNLAQVHQGDLITATYTEAIAFEVKKDGTGAGDGSTVVAKSAAPGAMPAGVVGRQTTVTVTIVAIDHGAPSVTFKGPAGNTRTIKVQHPEKLEGVNVGDKVEISYAEALAMKVEKAPKK
jgi:hypothetical protein